jgi:hypothetical protein
MSLTKMEADPHGLWFCTRREAIWWKYMWVTPLVSLCPQSVDGLLRGLSASLKLKPDEVPARVAAMQVGLLSGVRGSYCG